MGRRRAEPAGFCRGISSSHPHARSEIRVGANTINLSNGTEIGLVDLRDDSPKSRFYVVGSNFICAKSAMARPSRSIFHKAAFGCSDPGFSTLMRGGDQSSRVTVFAGTAHLAGAAGDSRIEAGQTAVLARFGCLAAATIEPATYRTLYRMVSRARL